MYIQFTIKVLENVETIVIVQFNIVVALCIFWLWCSASKSAKLPSQIDSRGLQYSRFLVATYLSCNTANS